jgi:hypothetical protein
MRISSPMVMISAFIKVPDFQRMKLSNRKLSL